MTFNARPVETAAELPRFCSRCGRRLVIEDRTDHFDARTGAPVLVAFAFCRGSWLERLFRDASPYHDSYVVSPRPRPSLPPPDFGLQRRA